MSKILAKNFILANPFKGEPKEDDFNLVEEELPPLENGEVLVQAEWLSVDPYMRVYMARLPPKSQMIGHQVGKVLDSKNPNFPLGSYVVGAFGWRTHTIFNPDNSSSGRPYLLPNIGDLPRSLAVGALGMPGNTAYFGLLELCQPKEGEILVVSGAAGAVGSLVGQIGKIKGLRVIGIAGSSEKCKWLTEELGFDYAINYKTANISEELKKAAPKGIDCYFDNVGGEISSAVINQMNSFGRISVCGSITAYNLRPEDYPKVPILQPTFVFKQLKMEGFLVNRWLDRWAEGIQQITEWIQEGKIKHQETVTEGFSNMPKAFIEMLRGENTGKAVVKA